MKKNKPLRAAGIMLIAAMLTTSMVSGTFAKYTTGDSAEDSARVAKFGVTVTADGSLFGEEYAEVGDGTGNSNGIITYSNAANTGTVQVRAVGENVVAPGTQNNTGLGFSIKGKPEVDVTVTDSEISTKNIYLKAGTYGVMVPVTGITDVNFAAAGDLYTVAGADDATVYTKADAYTADTTYYKLQDVAVVADDYYPVVFTLEGDTSYDTGDTTADSLAAIKTALDAKLTANTGIIQANTDLADAASLNLDNEVIKWSWKFEEADGSTDPADTILGDLAAKGDAEFAGTVVKLNDDGTYIIPVRDAAADDTDDDTSDYCLDVIFNLSLTVTQID
ncbi:MAG: hypothetical protein ACI4F6_03250 [Acutalibacteraceae bacterium]